MARGMIRAGSRTSSPMVAMRAYPAKAKNRSPPACRTPYAPPGGAAPKVDAAGPDPAKSPATRTTARPASTIPTSTLVAEAVRVTPKQLTATTPSTARAATGRCQGSGTT